MVIYRCHCCGDPVKVCMESMLNFIKFWREEDDEIAL